MTVQRSRRFLIIAVALSLLLHLIFALVARWPRPPAEQIAQRISHVRIVRIRRAVPTPPPTLTTPQPAPALPARHGKVTLPVLSHAGTASSAATVAVQPTPFHTAPATPGLRCTTRNAPAAKATSPPPPELAPAVRAQAVSGTTSVLVHLDDKGNVIDASIAVSSGSPSLDVAALATARGTTYTPAIANCKAVAGDYTFVAKWIAW